MAHKRISWYFQFPPSCYLGRVCTETRTIPAPVLGLVRSFDFERRNVKSADRYWVWVRAIREGRSVDYRFSDDEIGYIDVPPSKLLTPDDIVGLLNGSKREWDRAVDEYGGDSPFSKAAEDNYRWLHDELGYVLAKNGVESSHIKRLVLAQHYLSVVGGGA